MHEYQSKDNLFPSKLQQSGICPDMFYCIISPLHNTSICGQERENFTRRDHIVYQISYKKNLRHVRLNQWKLVFMIKGGILRRKVIEFERKRKRKVLVYLEAGGGIIGLTNTNLSAWHLSQSIGMSCYNNWSKATLFLLRLRPHATPRLLILKNTPTKKWLCIVERNR